MTRHVILGAGVAGLSAAQAIRATDRTAEITIVSEDPHGFYSRPGLAYYLTGELPEKQLYIYNREDWLRLNVRFTQAIATRLLPDEHRLELGSTGTLNYDRLLLATGARAAQMTIPGKNLEGVVYLDNMDNALHILRLARRGSAVVVGGGITALELAEGLASHRVQVHYLLRGDRYWPAVLDEEESRIIEKRLRSEHIQLHTRTELAEVLGKRGKVHAVRTTDGREFRCQVVAVAIGTLPRIDIARQAGLDTDKGILVNEFLQTSSPGIFAAGDCAQIMDPVTRASVVETLWNPARDQGRAAGLNMTGIVTPYRRSPALNVTRLAGLTVTLIGAIGGGRDADLVSIARGDSEAWRFAGSSITLYQSADVNRVRLVLGESTILGALVMGDQALSRPLQELINAQINITSIKDRLLQPDAPLGKLIEEFWLTSYNAQIVQTE